MNEAALLKTRFLYGMDIDSFMAYAHIPGAGMAWTDGEAACEHYRGVMRAGESRKIGKSTLFQAGSISKTAFAYLVMRLYDKDIVDIDAPLDKILSRFSIGAPVTFRSLLSHTAGINVHGFDGYIPGSEADIVSVIEGKGNSPKIARDLAPDSYFRYSGGGYTLAQYALSALTKRDIPSLAEEYVFAPLGMTNSAFSQPLSASLIERAATGHPSDLVPLEHTFMVHPELAAAGLWSTPNDILKLAQAIYLSYKGGMDAERGFLSESAARLMTAPVYDRMCIGLFTDRDATVRYHGGSNIGYESYFGFSLKSGLCFAFMTNANGGRALGVTLANALLDEEQRGA